MSTFDPLSLAAWCGGEWTPAPPRTPITRVVHDSREVGPGALFVAIRGERLDGHRYLGAAGAAGAVAAVVCRDADVTDGAALPLLRVDDTNAALSDLAAGHRRGLRGVVVGVTGSVGKSTVKEMLATVLEAAGPVARTRGNWNNDIGMPLSLLAMDAGDRAGVFEIGMNHPGELARLCAVLRPQCGIVTPIGPVHIEPFGTVEGVAAEKSVLLLALPGDGLAVFDADSPYARLLRDASAAPIATVSSRSGADIRWSAERGNVVRLRDEQAGVEVTAELPVPGRHNAMNAALAAAMASRRFNLPLPTIADRVARFVPMAMRWQELDVHGIRVINDAYNANPLSMDAAVAAFADIGVAGGKWLVLGDMLELGERGVADHRALGRRLATGCWAGLVTVGSLGAAIAEEALAQGLGADRVRACETCGEAAGVLRAALKPGDAVLLKASRGVALERIVSELQRVRQECDHE